MRNVLPLLTALALSLPGAAGADPSALVEAKRALQSGMDQGQVSRMLEARGRFLGLVNAEPRNAALHYWVALADWRIVPMLSGKDDAKAKLHCDEGLAQCDLALAADPKSAEALALKAGLQGMAIQFNGASGITLAPQMIGNLSRATELAPANPRVRLLDGINTFHMPAFLGGGAVPALEKLKKAHALYAAEAADSTAPDWGRDDAFAWAGRCEMKLADFEAARDDYRKALDVNPSNGWVRKTLLPAAQDSLARRSKP